jgi:hypothetical protein
MVSSMLLIIKSYITCEGHYSLFFYFHFRLLMVFLGFELNLPYYSVISKAEKEMDRGNYFNQLWIVF